MSGREFPFAPPSIIFPLPAVFSAYSMAGAPAASLDHEASLRMKAGSSVRQSRRTLGLLKKDQLRQLQTAGLQNEQRRLLCG